MSRRTTLEQALLDALSNAEKAGDNEKARIYKQALDTERKDTRRSEIDKTFSSHQYKNVHYGQLANVRDNPANWLILKGLSPKACKLLLCILVVATSEYIAISRNNLADLVGEQNKSRIKAPLQELVDSTALTLEVEYDEKTSTPAIYRISSAIFRVGKARRVLEEDVKSFFGDIDTIKDKDMKEWLPMLFKRVNSPDHNTDGAGYYPSSKKMRVPSSDGDGYKDVIVSTIQYYSGPPIKNEEGQSLTSKQKKSSADKTTTGSSQPTTNDTYIDNNTVTSNLSSINDLSNEQMEEFIQSLYCPGDDDNCPSDAF